ncbi:MAG: UbiX family flavin prenyltransferase [Peptococcaceae bacterium]|nr:UbiX family flavin prenyltransferase [Peptococcaceae bacterium]
MMRLIVAITGASGSIYGIRLLERLLEKKIETHLIISKWGEAAIASETGYDCKKIKRLASHYYGNTELGAVISSGSFKWDGMIVAPCSMKTLSAIANGFSESLVARVADVALKERRRLILMPRETPLTNIHLENMLRLSQAGAVIMPPLPAFYLKPQTVDDLINHTVYRVLSLFDLDFPEAQYWPGIDK